MSLFCPQTIDIGEKPRLAREQFYPREAMWPLLSKFVSNPIQVHWDFEAENLPMPRCNINGLLRYIDLLF